MDRVQSFCARAYLDLIHGRKAITSFPYFFKMFNPAANSANITAHQEPFATADSWLAINSLVRNTDGANLACFACFLERLVRCQSLLRTGKWVVNKEEINIAFVRRVKQKDISLASNASWEGDSSVREGMSQLTHLLLASGETHPHPSGCFRTHAFWKRTLSLYT